ncbi:MAG: hypothetical protein OEU86_09470 [Gammaproteobacteria bacterium]|nr:hypothetical protein [Gammaproteobacteria bacterium]
MSGHRKVTVRIRRTSIKATCAALMLMHALTSIAYEISTHQVLSSAAVNKSVLAGSDLLPRLGLSAYGSNQLPNAEDAGLVEQSFNH